MVVSLIPISGFLMFLAPLLAMLVAILLFHVVQ